MGGEIATGCVCIFIVIGFRFISSYAVTERGVAPFGMQTFMQLIIVLKGRSVKARGEMKWNPVRMSLNHKIHNYAPVIG
jgi:hypothetical protein